MYRHNVTTFDGDWCITDKYNNITIQYPPSTFQTNNIGKNENVTLSEREINYLGLREWESEIEKNKLRRILQYFLSELIKVLGFDHRYGLLSIECNKLNFLY